MFKRIVATVLCLTFAAEISVAESGKGKKAQDRDPGAVPSKKMNPEQKRTNVAPELKKDPDPIPVQPEKEPRVEEQPSRRRRRRMSVEEGSSLAPVVGYEPVYGLVVGGAYFNESSKTSFGIDFNVNFKNVYQVHSNVKLLFKEFWEFQVNVGMTEGFDPFYGNGGETNPAAFSRLWGMRSSNRMMLRYRLTPIIYAGIFTDIRFRSEKPEDEPDPTFVRRFPNERTMGFGFTASLDTRKAPDIAQDAILFTAEYTYVPSGLSTIGHAKDFSQLEGTFSVYKEISPELLPEFMAAIRVMGAMTLGEPSYMFKYRLGGSDRLRGYLENRFRGSKYYLEETEIRFPIWKLVSGAAFIGFGDTSDSSFTNPKMSYGVGVHLGLPPDYISRVRVDFGFGRDEKGVFADFGQIF